MPCGRCGSWSIRRRGRSAISCNASRPRSPAKSFRAAARGTTCRGRSAPMRPTSPRASTATARRAASLDEQGRAVPAGAAAVAAGRRQWRRLRRQIRRLGSRNVARRLSERLEQLGIRVAPSSPRRADMAAAMREHGATLGGGPSGRSGTPRPACPCRDALMTVTRLLVLLSRSDEPLSVVLDRDAPGCKMAVLLSSDADCRLSVFHFAAFLASFDILSVIRASLCPPIGLPTAPVCSTPRASARFSTSGRSSKIRSTSRSGSPISTCPSRSAGRRSTPSRAARTATP